jgi:Fe-S cluster assembly ATP-binding protein
MSILRIDDLVASIDENKILNGINLTLQPDKVHVLMGQNGSGKSTLAQTLMGDPKIQVQQGNITFHRQDLLAMPTEDRSLAGIFLSFQYPGEISGVTVLNFLRMVYNKRQEKPLSPIKFRQLLIEKMGILEMKEEFMHRYLNDGFSGGEKKRMEMLQMLVLEPKIAILDEVDSGLDIDAIQLVARAVNTLKGSRQTTILLITHYARILQYIRADYVHIMKEGRIVREGDVQLAHELEKKGYAQI